MADDDPSSGRISGGNIWWNLFRLAIIVFLIIFIFLLWYLYPLYGTAGYPKYGKSMYEYYLYMNNWAATPVTNVTILIPIPMWSSQKPKYNYSITNDVFAKGYVYKNIPPPNYSFSIQEIQNQSYVNFTTDLMIPHYEYVLNYEQRNQGFENNSPFYSINTSNPVGTELLFYQTSGQKHSVMPASREKGITYTIPVYAEYRITSGNPEIEIKSYIEGTNIWLARHEIWDQNTYKDGFTVNLNNGSPQWVTVGGKLEYGIGSYPESLFPRT